MKTINFIFGLIIGGILALLFAPKSGKETREDVKSYLKDAEKDFEKYVKDKKNDTEKFIKGKIATLKPKKTLK